MTEERMTQKEELMCFLAHAVRNLDNAEDGQVTLRWTKKRAIESYAAQELKVIDGAMVAVGEPDFLGYAYELRFEIKGCER